LTNWLKIEWAGAVLCCPMRNMVHGFGDMGRFLMNFLKKYEYLK
jgi:hypothetical protein